MIDVKQIFESAILNEALGNLNNIPDSHAKKVITGLLKNRWGRTMADVSPNSAVDNLGSFQGGLTGFNQALKKYTAMGHRVGAVVFLPKDGKAVVTIINDHRYVSDGAVRNDIVVRSADWEQAQTGRFGSETTLGKMTNVYFDLKNAENVDVYVILRDPALTDKIESRQKAMNFKDPYAPGANRSGKSEFMTNAIANAAVNRVSDLDKLSLLDVIKSLAVMKKHFDYGSPHNAVVSMKVGGKTYLVAPESISRTTHSDSLEDLAVRGTPCPIASIRVVKYDEEDNKYYHFGVLELSFDKNFKLLANYNGR